LTGAGISTGTDRSGVEHLLKVDFGCRNTQFNIKPQTGGGYSPCGIQASNVFAGTLFDEDTQITLWWVQPYSDALLGCSLLAEVWKRE
tara:strand:- start:2523 stop:2786 length:264 start_codon:yes stop_codon:yes gene_type:complete